MFDLATLGTIAAIAVPCVTVIGWMLVAWRKITVNEAVTSQHLKTCSKREKRTDERLESVEEKQDKLNDKIEESHTHLSDKIDDLKNIMLSKK